MLLVGVGGVSDEGGDVNEPGLRKGGLRRFGSYTGETPAGIGSGGVRPGPFGDLK